MRVIQMVYRVLGGKTYPCSKVLFHPHEFVSSYSSILGDM